LFSSTRPSPIVIGPVTWFLKYRGLGRPGSRSIRSIS
jgi:hypothetical protein